LLDQPVFNQFQHRLTAIGFAFIFLRPYYASILYCIADKTEIGDRRQKTGGRRSAPRAWRNASLKLGVEKRVAHAPRGKFKKSRFHFRIYGFGFQIAGLWSMVWRDHVAAAF
jgi:hypothetical protein